MIDTSNVAVPPELVRPEELRRIADEKEMASLRETLEQASKHEKEQKDQYHAFVERHLGPEAPQRFSEMVRNAAARGQREIEVLRFPSDWCTDRGRAINNSAVHWPETLTGFAQEAYQAFDKALHPLGYKMRAQIMDYPKGMPGDVALFISW